jgi:hypothetical protein
LRFFWLVDGFLELGGGEICDGGDTVARSTMLVRTEGFFGSRWGGRGISGAIRGDNMRRLGWRAERGDSTRFSRRVAAPDEGDLSLVMVEGLGPAVVSEAGETLETVGEVAEEVLVGLESCLEGDV